MRFSRLLFLFFAFSIVTNSIAASTVFAQSSPAYKLQKVRFVGSKRYTQEQLLKASGLKLGSTYSAQDFQNAADALNSSGAFSQVGYRFNGIEAEYQLIDNIEFVPCHFENLVWMSDEDIQATLKKRLPLFTGEVPTNGDLAMNVGKEIESILKEKGIAASISSLPQAKLNGPVQAMTYSAVTPQVLIASFEFPGASPATVAGLNKASASIVGTEYSRSMLPGVMDVRFKPIYLNHGYLKASFSEPVISVTSNSPETTKVSIRIPVYEGKQYRLAALNWSGSEAISPTTAAKLYALKPGEIANQELLKKSLSVIASAYFSKGYLKANVKAIPNFDEAGQTVSYDISVFPGDLYHLRKVEFQNLNEVQLKQVKDAWKLREGDVYDPAYVQTFLMKNRSVLHALDGWSAVWTQKINDDDKVVDLTVIFKRGGPLQSAGQ